MFTSAFLLSLILSIINLFGISKAQFATYNYEMYLVPGKPQYIYSDNFFAGNYPSGNIYHWNVQSNSRIRIDCNLIFIPQSDQCYYDALIIKRSIYYPGQRYCGSGTIQQTSTANSMNITLQSYIRSRGGRFSCMLQTVRCTCGWKNPARIVNGEETGVNEFPMMAGLVDADSPPVPFRMVFCGATIINNKQVITAAHCLNKKNLSRIGVLIGDHNLSESSDTNATLLFQITSVVPYPLYDKDNNNFDIAVINIAGVINFHQRVGPACLPFRNIQDSFAQQWVTLLGWGMLENDGSVSRVLQKVNVRVVSNSNCYKFYRNLQDYQLCSYESGKDSCQHDSGGPVLWRDPISKRLNLIGLISWGGLCADNQPTVNTRITSFLSWLEQVKPPDFEYCKDP